MEKLSYALGLMFGNSLKEMGVAEIHQDKFAKAVADVLSGATPEMTVAEAQQKVTVYLQALEEEKGKAVREEGEKFLAENAKKEGIITLPSGLQYEVITEGNGKKPSATDRVKCHYEGTLIDGTLFDSSIKRGQPAVFGVNQVIKGWVEALQLMSEGSKWRLFIPSELGYGAQQAGEMIPPHSTLIFEVELIEVL